MDARNFIDAHNNMLKLMEKRSRRTNTHDTNAQDVFQTPSVALPLGTRAIGVTKNSGGVTNSISNGNFKEAPEFAPTQSLNNTDNLDPSSPRK